MKNCYFIEQVAKLADDAMPCNADIMQQSEKM